MFISVYLGIFNIPPAAINVREYNMALNRKSNLRGNSSLFDKDTVSYRLRVYSTSCVYWDKIGNDWSTDGCMVSDSPSSTMVLIQVSGRKRGSGDKMIKS